MKTSPVRAAFAAVCVATLSAFGAGVSGDDAKGAVAGWVRLREALGDEIDAEPESVVTYQGRDGVGEFHVVSLVGGGYVITSGDTEITPILGYSKTGTFDADEDSPMWAFLTADVAARAAALEASGGGTASGQQQGVRLTSASGTTASVQQQEGNSDKWARLIAVGKSGGKRLQARLTSPPADLRVASFVQSKWSQRTARSGNGYTHNYYNYYLPDYPCGCVATAQAQVMRYFEWPKISVEAKTFSCQTNNVTVNLTMKGGTYDWAHMPYDPSTVASDWDNVLGIAKLTYDAGVSVRMQYGPNGSGASGCRISGSLTGTFGYSNAVFDYEDKVGASAYKKEIIPNLDARIPVILAIIGKKTTASSSNDSGHAIITDGYGYYNDELYIHLNFGWSGTDNYWYTPAEMNATGGGYLYTNITTVVYNIFTNATQYSVIASGRVLDQNGEAISGATVTAKYNNSTYATATSDERGVYALILPPNSSPRTYTVNATHAEYTSVGALSVIASRTTSDRIRDDGAIYYSEGSNSNSYDNDITMESLDLPKLATPESPTATEFETSASVTLTCATNGATIYYTLDGSTPTASSTLYTGPFTLTKTTMVKARAFKSGYASSDVFIRTFVSAAAIDEYYFRHDFSGGTQVFTAGEGTGLTRDQVSSADSSNAKAVAGPDGPGTAFHPGNAWGQFERPTVLHGAWSAAMSLCMDATENGVLVSFGRLNTTDQKEVALLSSSTKSNLYFKVMTTDSNKAKSVENTFTVVTTNDLTEGFHTIVVAYTPASEVLNGVGSFDIYCDGVLVRTVSTDTPKLLGANVGGMQYCYLMSGGNDHAALGAVPSQTNDEVAFYDFRFYDRAFTASEAAKYAVAYPGPEPEPEPGPEPGPAFSLLNAYAQSGSANLLMHLDAIDNAGVGQHETSPETWADLTGNHAVTNKNSATFSDDAFVANQSSWFSSASDSVKSALTGTGARFTLELVISHSNQVKQVGSSWVYENYVFIGTSTSRTLVVDVRPKNSSYPTVQGVQYHASGWEGKAAIGTSPARTAWNKRSYIAVVCNGNTATTYCDGDKQIHSITCSTAANPASNAISIGASGGANPLYANAEICAVRMTNRILSEDERMRNYFIDSQRFGLDAPDGYRLTNGVIQVRLTEGVEGFEFSTNGTTWAAGEVWSDLNQPVTLYARLAESPSATVAFRGLPDGATVDGNSATFTPTKPYAISALASKWKNNDGTGSLDSAANWTQMPASGDDVILELSGDVAITSSGAKTFGKMTINGAYLIDFSGAETISLSGIELNSVTNLVTGGKLRFTAIAIPSTCTVTITGAEGLGNGGLTGSGTLVIDPGAGNTYKMSNSNTGFLGQAVVASGTVKFGDRRSFGPRYDNTNVAGYHHYCPTVRVRGGATIDANNVDDGAYSTDTGKNYVRLEAGAKVVSNPGASNVQRTTLTGVTADGDSTVDTSSGVVSISHLDNYAPTYINLGNNTLTKTGANKFYISRCVISGAGTFDIAQGVVESTYSRYGSGNRNTTTCSAGTIRIRSGASWNLLKVGDNASHLSVKNLILEGSVTRTSNTAHALTVTGSITGNGTTPMLTMGSNAVFKPTGTGYLTISESLSDTMKIDLSGIDLSTARRRIPLFKVGSSAMLPATEALQFVGEIPKGWHLESSREGYGYDLVHRYFTIIIK